MISTLSHSILSKLEKARNMATVPVESPFLVPIPKFDMRQKFKHRRSSELLALRRKSIPRLILFVLCLLPFSRLQRVVISGYKWANL